MWRRDGPRIRGALIHDEILVELGLLVSKAVTVLNVRRATLKRYRTCP